MEEQDKKENWFKRKWNWFKRKWNSDWNLYFIIGAVYLVFAIFIISENLEGWNEIGDAFNVITSLFSGLALIMAFRAIFMQREELGLQREELELTRVEFEIKRANDVVWQQIKNVNSQLDLSNEKLKTNRECLENVFNEESRIDENNKRVMEAYNSLSEKEVTPYLDNPSDYETLEPQKQSVANCAAFNHHIISQAHSIIALYNSMRSNELRKYEEKKNEELKSKVIYQYELIRHIIINNLHPELFEAGRRGSCWKAIVAKMNSKDDQLGGAFRVINWLLELNAFLASTGALDSNS
jgi:hypothetical protein